MHSSISRLIPLFLFVVVLGVSSNPTRAQNPARSSEGSSRYGALALAYVSLEQGLSKNILSVAHETNTTSELLNITYQVVTVVDNQKRDVFKILVDWADGRVREISEVAEEENQAYAKRFGKFERSLFEKLQTISSSEKVEATIILATQLGQSSGDFELQIRNELAARYPEIQAAVRDHRHFTDIPNKNLARRVQREYMTKLRQRMKLRIQPLIALLNARGIPHTLLDGMPVIIVNITKEQLLALTNLPAVSAVLATPGKLSPATTGVFQTAPVQDPASLTASHIPEVWALGYTGSDTSVAVLDLGIADITSSWTSCQNGDNCFPNVGLTRSAGGISNHATGVSSIIASNAQFFLDPTKTIGVAPDATLHRAGADDSFPAFSDLYNALDWALTTADADVVNTSLADLNTEEMGFTTWDWIYDARARSDNRLLVTAAGNNRENVRPPARGWNVLTVGAYDHSTFEMWGGSSWGNASEGDGGEKPDVVAPGVGITFVKSGGDTGSGVGTSLAAPQVAGIAALMIDVHPQLRDNPTAMKAILMATATTNISGTTGIPYGDDHFDGAGGVHAFNAAKSAAIRGSSFVPCNNSCWISENLSSSDFTDSRREYTVYAEAGDRIRIAASWWAKAERTSLFTTIHALKSDFDVWLEDPDGNWIDSSRDFGGGNSVDVAPSNGYIIANKTGYYKLVLYTIPSPIRPGVGQATPHGYAQSRQAWQPSGK